MHEFTGTITCTYQDYKQLQDLYLKMNKERAEYYQWLIEKVLRKEKTKLA